MPPTVGSIVSAAIGSATPKAGRPRAGQWRPRHRPRWARGARRRGCRRRAAGRRRRIREWRRARAAAVGPRRWGRSRWARGLRVRRQAGRYDRGRRGAAHWRRRWGLTEASRSGGVCRSPPEGFGSARGPRRRCPRVRAAQRRRGKLVEAGAMRCPRLGVLAHLRRGERCPRVVWRLVQEAAAASRD